jgi:hypothetical protein
MVFYISSNNIQIKDSYTLSKKEFEDTINNVKQLYPNNLVCINRSNFSIKMEIATHNLCYNLGIARSRTKDVDINYPLSKLEKITYTVVGPLAWLFIK